MISYAFSLVLQLMFWVVRILFWLICGVFYWIFTGDSFKSVMLRLFTVVGLALSVWGGIELYNRHEASKRQQFRESLAGTTEYVCIANEFINIRVSPNTKADVLGRVNRGGTVYVYEIKDGFARVKFGNGIGYANAKFIKIREKR